MIQKRIFKYSQLLTVLVFIVQGASAFGAEFKAISVGSQLPPFTLGAPNSPDEQQYLGLKSNAPFTLSDIGSKLVFIEFMEAF